MTDTTDPTEHAVAVLRQADTTWYAMVNVSVNPTTDEYLRHQARALAAAGLLPAQPQVGFPVDWRERLDKQAGCHSESLLVDRLIGIIEKWVPASAA